MNRLSYNYKKCIFPNEWKEIQIKDALELVERPIKMIDSELYELVTVKRNFKGIESRGLFEGEKILVKSQFKVKFGDFLISKRQISHGACGIVPEKLNNSIVSNEYNIFKSKVGVDLEFFDIYTQLPFMKRNFYISSDGVHIEKLLFKTKNWISRNICLPSYDEQKKILLIYKTLEKNIILKEKIFKEKQNSKKGLMQNLLTANIRIKGFYKDWKHVKIGTVMKERREIGYNNLELLAITSSNGVVRRVEVDIRDNSSEDKSKYKRILPGDVGYNTMRMWQGVSGISKYEGIVSPAYTILKPIDKVNSEFMAHLFKLPQIINLFHRYSQGLVNDTLNLKYENLKGINVYIPQELGEQKEISKILNLADKEIDLLKKEIQLLKEQKKGLMQLLLTGRVRV
ncbi:restriction endonuclease subunit S [Clostridium gasigenes]|uniref:Restriction endonuclease subunit S n=1 Tax=Clostridium gasigenes TaxID=94869 RepID=A0A7X0S9D5_9CLOT|nr:restriction endonuclease subunit S [Clostridium gasigenes]MBB6713404.1 restriction endonuclease subunit S [Clostridium gasigenes]